MTRWNELWVCAFDGGLARVWTADGHGRLHELTGEGLDARGDSGGPRQGEPDLHRTGYVEQWTPSRFVEKFASRLADRAGQGVFRQLIVAADPKSLGMFRDCAPEALRRLIVAELPKDHVHTPVKALEAALAGHLSRTGAEPG